MNKINADILYHMYDNLSLEIEEINNITKKNLLRITEIDKFLDSVKNAKKNEYDVFSPREKAKLYNDEISKLEEEKNILDTDNKTYYHRYNVLSSYLNDLTKVLHEDDIKVNLQVLEIQEEERQRIARDLHDTSLQNLANLMHKIELSSMFIDQDPIRAKLELAIVNKNLKAIIKDIRNTLFDLRSMTFDDLGLREAFNQMFIMLKDNNSIDFITDIDDIELDNDLVTMTIFRIVQECCSNAIKHAGGNKIVVTIKIIEEKCDILIEDNGHGFDINAIKHQEERHFGLHIMKERVKLLRGHINIESHIDIGTKIHISIPIKFYKGGNEE